MTRPIVAVLAPAVALVVALAGVARATPTQELDQARAEFRAGEFDKALKTYNALLYPPPPRLSNPADLTEAYVSLGVCRVEAGDLEGARREFENALQLDPNWQLDPTVITNRAAIKLFDDTKVDLRVRAEREAARQQHALDLERQRKFLESLKVYEAHSLWLNFLPFGAGQFQNHQWVKGSLFAAGETVTGVGSFAIWYYLVNKYGISNQHLHVGPDEARNIRRLQQLEIGAGVAFIGIYAWSIVDALLHYTPQQRVQADRSLLPPELRDPARAPHHRPAKTSLLDHVHLAPMITPDGVGVGLSWETR